MPTIYFEARRNLCFATVHTLLTPAEIAYSRIMHVYFKVNMKQLIEKKTHYLFLSVPQC